MCDPINPREQLPAEVAREATLVYHLTRYGAATMVRDARHRHGLSQAGLAQRLGVRQAAVSQWEARRTLPKVRYLHQVMDLLASNPDDSTV